MQIKLANPRGFCAGVDRAIEIVNRALEVFGAPIFTYSYREAVADDWLIDHEPPIRYQTLLSQNGIHFAKGESVSIIDTATGEVDVAELEDELAVLAAQMAALRKYRGKR